MTHQRERDLVERLREQARHIRKITDHGDWAYASEGYAKLYDAAAAEIERLTTAIAAERQRTLKAILEALREPTEEMLVAGNTADLANGGAHGCYTIEDVWQAMIDSALSPSALAEIEK